MAGTESVKERAPAALSSAVAFIVGFVPWIVYWILVGNAPFLAAVLAGLGLAVVINVSSLVRRQPLMVLESAPSSATWVGLGENGSLVGIPAWTLHGDDLPAVQTDHQAVLSEIARQAFRRRGRRTRFGPALLQLSRGFAPKLDDPEVTGAAVRHKWRRQLTTSCSHIPMPAI